jgi:hypothetical protein
MSSTNAAPRFQSWVGQLSNLDRCERCHMPRSAHGADWSCPPKPPPGVATIPLAVGINLVLAAIIVRVLAGSLDQGQATLIADAFVLGVILIVAGMVGIGQQH